MISSTDKLHQKHAKLSRSDMGEWGRNELAILGTECNSIKQLANTIIQQLSSFKIAYADADHKSEEAELQSISAINAKAYIEYVNKISFTQVNINSQPSAFQKRALLNDCSLVLVNGNHFTASRQIIVIDDKKPLEKKLDKLTNVQLILLKDSSQQIPDSIRNHIPNFTLIPVLLFDDKEAIVNHITKLIKQQTAAVNGLVLSGGKSTRMGRDKGDIAYYNKSQREYVFDLLKEYCHETFISCNNEQVSLLSQSLPVIEDTFLGLGPLSGILSAFQFNPNVAWLTVACDLPFLSKDIIQFLIEHRNPYKMATAFWDSEERFPEPLITIWEPKAYAVLLQFLSQGCSCPRKALINSNIEMVHAPDVSAFKNVNTTEEYNDAIETIRSKHNYC